MQKSLKKSSKTKATSRLRSKDVAPRASSPRDIGEVIALRLVNNVYKYFLDITGNCDCTIGGDIESFPVIRNPKENRTANPADWISHTVAFKLKGERYRIFFAFEFNQSSQTIQQHLLEKFPSVNEFSELAGYATNFWIQMEKTKYVVPFIGGADSQYLVLFDAWPHHRDISLFPHHMHKYEVDRNAKGPALDFLPSLDELLEGLTSQIPIFG